VGSCMLESIEMCEMFGSHKTGKLRLRIYRENKINPLFLQRLGWRNWNLSVFCTPELPHSFASHAQIAHVRSYLLTHFFKSEKDSQSLVYTDWNY